jgi:hypothetical protein
LVIGFGVIFFVLGLYWASPLAKAQNVVFTYVAPHASSGVIRPATNSYY